MSETLMKRFEKNQLRKTTEQIAREVRMPASDLTRLFDNEARAVSNARADGQIECALELLTSADALLKGADSHVLRAGSHIRRAGRLSGDCIDSLQAAKRAAQRVIAAADEILAERPARMLQAAE